MVLFLLSSFMDCHQFLADQINLCLYWQFLGGGLSLEMVTYSYHLFPLNQANWVFLGIGSNRFLAHPSTSLTSSSLLLNYLSLFHLQRSLTWSLPSDIFFFSTLPPSHWMVSHPWLGLMGSQLLPSWLLWWKEMSKAFQTLIVKW